MIDTFRQSLLAEVFKPVPIQFHADVLRGLRARRRSCRANTSTTRSARPCSSRSRRWRSITRRAPSLPSWSGTPRRWPGCWARVAFSSSMAAAAASRPGSCSTSCATWPPTCPSTSRASTCAARPGRWARNTRTSRCCRSAETSPGRWTCPCAGSPRLDGWSTFPARHSAISPRRKRPPCCGRQRDCAVAAVGFCSASICGRTRA